MKIAHIVPVMNTIPPQKYGGIEEVVTQLALGQIGQGHKVTIFAAKGSGIPSKPEIKIVEASPYPTRNKSASNRYWEIHELLLAIAKQDEFDIIHFHYEPIIVKALIDNSEFNLMEYIKKPFIVTFHNTTNIKENISYYRNHRKIWKYNIVFISHSHKKPLKFLPNTNVVYNGIPIEKFEFNNKPKDYLLFLGRITKFKGIVEAIKCARLAGKKLLIAAKIDAVDRDFYEKKVKNLIDGKQIIYLGEVDFKQKVRLYKDALALLFPITWEEPFGLVMVESLACGTPVIAFDNGSVPEIVIDKKTGFVVENIEQMVQAIGRLHEIDRRHCRDSVEAKFSAKKMTMDYLKIYKKILQP